MKKSTSTLLAATGAAVLGAVLLLGGAGSLAFWSTTEASATQQILSGTLDLGTSGGLLLSDASIRQCTPTCTDATPSFDYTGGAIVPGDVITATVNIPVTLEGQNLAAQFTVTPSKTAGSTAVADTALRDALSVRVTSINGTVVAGNTASATLSPATVTDFTVPVVVEVHFPWGSAGQYTDAMSGTVALGATYTLTQIAAG